MFTEEQERLRERALYQVLRIPAKSQEFFFTRPKEITSRLFRNKAK